MKKAYTTAVGVLWITCGYMPMVAMLGLTRTLTHGPKEGLLVLQDMYGELWSGLKEEGFARAVVR